MSDTVEAASAEVTVQVSVKVSAAENVTFVLAEVAAENTAELSEEVHWKVASATPVRTRVAILVELTPPPEVLSLTKSP